MKDKKEEARRLATPQLTKPQDRTYHPDGLAPIIENSGKSFSTVSQTKSKGACLRFLKSGSRAWTHKVDQFPDHLNITSLRVEVPQAS